MIKRLWETEKKADSGYAGIFTSQIFIDWRKENIRQKRSGS